MLFGHSVHGEEHRRVPARVRQLLGRGAERVCDGGVASDSAPEEGSGPHAHGQVLIYHDMFGLYPKFKPRMAKVFGDAGSVIANGLKQYVQEVTDGSFPQPENYFRMKDEEYDELSRLLKQ